MRFGLYYSSLSLSAAVIMSPFMNKNRVAMGIQVHGLNEDALLLSAEDEQRGELTQVDLDSDSDSESDSDVFDSDATGGDESNEELDKSSGQSGSNPT